MLLINNSFAEETKTVKVGWKAPKGLQNNDNGKIKLAHDKFDFKELINSPTAIFYMPE